MNRKQPPQTLITASILNHLRKTIKPVKTVKQPSTSTDSERLQQSYETLQDDLFKISLTAPIRNLDRRTQRKIRRLISDHLIQKYPETFRDLMVDVCEEYAGNVKKIGAVQKIKTKFCLGPSVNVPPCHDHWLTRDKFSRRMKTLSKNLFLTTSLFRFIQHESIHLAQSRLVNVRTYRNRGGINLPLLRACIKNDIQTNHQSFNTFIAKLSIKFKQATFLNHLEARLWVRFVIAAKKFIQVKIITYLTDATNFVIDDFHRGFHPLITFKLTGCLTIDQTVSGSFFNLTPEYREVVEFYREIIALLTCVRVELPKIAAILLLPSDYYKFDVNAPKYYQLRVGREIKFILNRLFSGLNGYLARLKDDFQVLFEQSYKEKVLRLCSDFDLTAINHEIDNLNRFLTTINHLPFNVDFDVGCLNQEHLIKNLLNRVNHLRDYLFNRLTTINRMELDRLTNQLHVIEEKSTKIPENTSELIDLTDFMAVTKTEKIDTFRVDVLNVFKMNLNLLQRTNVPVESISATAILIKSLRTIGLLIDKNVFILDNRKNELEEDLQKRFDDLNQSIVDYLTNLPLLDLMSDLKQIDSYLTFLKPMILIITDFQGSLAMINEEEGLFKFPLSQIVELDELKTTIFKFVDLVWLCKECTRFEARCMDGPFETLTYDQISLDLQGYLKQLHDFHKYYSDMIRSHINDNHPRRFKGMVDDPDPFNHPAPLKLLNQSMKLLMDFNNQMRLVKCFCSPALQKRHWDEMSTMFMSKINVETDDASVDMTDLTDLTPDYGTTLRQMCRNHFDDELMTRFEVVNLTAVKELELSERLAGLKVDFSAVQWTIDEWIDNIDDVVFEIDVKINQLIDMKSSVFVDPIREDVNLWMIELECLRLTSLNINYVQRLIRKYRGFLMNDLANLLPKEIFRFKRINRSYESIKSFMSNNPRVNGLIDFNHLIDDIKHSELKIDDGLNVFYQNLRSNFSRFYFINNHDFISLHSINQTRQSYDLIDMIVRKIFPGIYKLTWIDDKIIGIENRTENVQFKRHVTFDICDIAQSFADIELGMIDGVKNEILDRFNRGMVDILDDLNGQYSQQVLKIVHKSLSWDMIDSIITNHQSFDYYKRKIKKDIEILRNQLKNTNDLIVQNKCIELTNNLINIQMIVESIIESHIETIHDFEYIKHIRHYMIDENVIVKFLNHSYDYKYEFEDYHQSLNQINSRIINHLFLCKSQCLFPVLTDKTVIETFGSILGVAVIHEECTNVRINEINRCLNGMTVNHNVVLCLNNIQNILEHDLPIFTEKFINHQSLNSSFWFVTTGSIDHLYPNVRQSFIKLRSISVNLKTYVEIYLYSRGFDDCERLSMKLTRFLELTKVRLRFVEIKNVLNYFLNNINRTDHSLNEKVLIDSLKTIPVIRDLKMIDTYLNAVFPLSRQQSVDESFEIDDQQASDLIVDEPDQSYFDKKLQEFHQSINQSQFIVLLGETSCKSTILRSAFDQLNRKYHVMIDFYDVNLIIELIQTDNCLVIDSTIDNATDIIDFHTNHLHVNGRKIPINPGFCLINETEDISTFTPGMLSQSQIIYFDRQSIDLSVIVKSRLTELNLADLNVALIMFNSLLIDLFHEIKSVNHLIVSLSELHMTQTVLNLFKMQMIDLINNQDDCRKYMTYWTQAVVITSITSGIYNLIRTSKLPSINQAFKDSFKRLMIDDKINLPNDGLLNDYVYIFKQKGSWKYLPDVVKSTKIEQAFYCDLVIDVNLLRLSPLIDMHIKHGQNLALIGQSCGKTAYIKNIYAHKFFESHNMIDVQLIDLEKCELIDLITQAVTTDQYNMKYNRKNMLFISKMLHGDGLNENLQYIRYMIDVIKSQSLNCQSINTRNSLEIQSKTFKTHEKLNVFTAIDSYMIDKVPKKFINHFNVYYLNTPGNDDLSRIVTTILFTNLRKNNFPNDILSTVNHLSTSVTDIYTRLKVDLNHCQSLFTINDLLRFTSSVSSLHKDHLDGKFSFGKFGIYECSRVFLDRIETVIDEKMIDQFQKDIIKVFNDNFQSKLTADSWFGNLNNMFQEVSIDRMIDHFTQKLDDYNQSFNQYLDVIFFKDTVVNLIKISRIFNFSRGNCIVTGPCGLGKKSLVKLASFMLDHTVYEAKIKQNYTKKDWRSDLRKVFMTSGGTGTKTTLILEPIDSVYQQMLIDLLTYTRSGTVQNLYTNEQQQVVLDSVKKLAQEGRKSLELSTGEVMSYFRRIYQKNLKVFLCLTAIGSGTKLRELTKHCHIVRFRRWDVEALEDIASHHIEEDTIIGNTTPEAIKKACGGIYHLILSHQEQITTNSYIFFLRTITHKLKTAKTNLKIDQNQYQTGLDKLIHATGQIKAITEEITGLEPQIHAVTERSKHMSLEISNESQTIAKTSQQIREEEKIVNVQAAAAESLKQECEKDLALAIPILEDAIIALNTLKPTDITLVKSMKNPPDVIKLVMAAVCVMKEIKPDRLPDVASGRKIIDYWGPSKRLLGEMNFLQQLKDYDKDNIPPQVMLKVREEYLPNKSFQPQIVAKASSAAEGLCKWVIAMDLYDKVAKEVAPKKAKLLIAEARYKKTLGELNEKRQLLVQIQEHLDHLNKQFDDNNVDLINFTSRVDMLKDKLEKATKLVDSLDVEKIAWIERIDEINRRLTYLNGDVMIDAAILAFFGMFDNQNRTELIDDIKRILDNHGIVFDGRLIDRSMIDENNRIIAECTDLRRWCVILDPHGIANRWIRDTYAENLSITKLNASDCYDKIETAINHGKLLLIENVGKINQFWINIVKVRWKKQNRNGEYFQLPHKIVESNGFRLFVTSNFDEPRLTDQSLHAINMINYQLNAVWLNNQFLDVITTKEIPTIANRLSDNRVEIARFKRDLLEAKHDILVNLNQSDENVIEDKYAIERSRLLKIKIAEFEMKIAGKTQEFKRLILHRLTYSGFSDFTRSVYELIGRFAKINPFYEYSMDFYRKIVQNAIGQADRSSDFDRRLTNLKGKFVEMFCSYFVKSLHESHIVYFRFLLGLLLLECHDETIKVVTDDVIDAVLLPNQNITDIKEKLTKFKEFDGFDIDFNEHNQLWNDFFTRQSFTYPRFCTKPIQKLLLTFYVDKNRLKTELNQHVTFRHVNNFNMLELYHQSNAVTPVVFQLRGVNPHGYLRDLAEKMHLGRHFYRIPAITDAGKLREMFRDKQKEECWLLIENCHVNRKFLVILQDVIDGLTFDNTHESFRVWLTYEADFNADFDGCLCVIDGDKCEIDEKKPVIDGRKNSPNYSRKFPKRVLQNSVKICCFDAQSSRLGLMNIFMNDSNLNVKCQNDTITLLMIVYILLKSTFSNNEPSNLTGMSSNFKMAVRLMIDNDYQSLTVKSMTENFEYYIDFCFFHNQCTRACQRVCKRACQIRSDSCQNEFVIDLKNGDWERVGGFIDRLCSLIDF